MKKLIALSFILVLTIPFYSFSQANEENRNVATFTEIDLRIAGNVILSQSATQKLVVKGNKNDLKDLITEVRGNTLIIKYDSWFSSHNEVEIDIDINNLEGIDVSGSGSIIADGEFTTNNVDFEVSGSGTINFAHLNTKKIDCEISGSGKINLMGNSKVESLEFDISGSGKINAFDIMATNVNGEISGSGKAQVYAESRLDAEISGSGRIYYKGNPRVNAEISGSGKVVSAE
ncbi:MAG: DUF2807 domain-containing protein [Chlorobi bacterium]|nr:DUF2807 domain-containing protein [Chlorobiota bacterium]